MWCSICSLFSSHTFPLGPLDFSEHTLAAGELLAWGWGASCSVSWNAVDFLNPHQSILGLWGRAYLRPPFPCELRLESVSEQLADSPSLTLLPRPCVCVDPKVQWKRTEQMKTKIVHLGKVKNSLTWHATRCIEFLWNFGSILSAECNVMVRLLGVKNRTGSTWDCCDSEPEQSGGSGWWHWWQGLIVTHHDFVFLEKRFFLYISQRMPAFCLVVSFQTSAG